MAKKDSKFYEWVESTLVNDESSTDKEMLNYFIKEGKMSRTEASFYLRQRNKALSNSINFELKKFR